MYKKRPTKGGFGVKIDNKKTRSILLLVLDINRLFPNRGYALTQSE